VSHGLGVPEIVDGNDLEVRTTFKVRPKEVPTNPPEAVYPYACFRHGLSLNNRATADAGSAGVGWKPFASRSEIAGSRHGARSAPDFRR
jgi:hypothetical protein